MLQAVSFRLGVGLSVLLLIALTETFAQTPAPLRKLPPTQTEDAPKQCSPGSLAGRVEQELPDVATLEADSTSATRADSAEPAPSAPTPLPPDVTARQSRQIPHLPEPMVFDLVRPLNAQRGELEVNSLFLHLLSGAKRKLEWAPEVEYAFRDGYAVEVELPFENTAFSAYKLGLQGTLGGGTAHFAHGWQVVGRYNRAERTAIVDGLYLTGYQFHPRWSVFTMQGARRSSQPGRPAWQGLFNPSVFHNFNPRLTLGLETNWTLGRRDLRQQVVMPQAQWILTQHYSVQFGVGAARQGLGRFSPLAGLRVIITWDKAGG